MTDQRKTAIIVTVFFLAHCYGYFGWALAAAAVCVVAWYLHRAWVATVDGVVAERRRLDEIRARADVQNAQVANGDPRGIYGS